MGLLQVYQSTPRVRCVRRLGAQSGPNRVASAARMAERRFALNAGTWMTRKAAAKMSSRGEGSAG